MINVDHVFCLAYNAIERIKGFKMKNIRKHLLRPHHLMTICYYCGDPATDKEHVIPRSLVGNNTPIVWACSECNGIAGARLFETIEEKREYIQGKLRHKYKALFGAVDWSDSEMKGMGYVLATEIKSHRSKQKWITNRINWSMSLHALIVGRILEDHAIGKSSVLTPAEQDTIRENSAKLCYSTEQTRPKYRKKRFKRVVQSCN